MSRPVFGRVATGVVGARSFASLAVAHFVVAAFAVSPTRADTSRGTTVCLNAPCTETGTDETRARRADCTSTVNPVSTSDTFTETCPATDGERAAFRGTIWSAPRLDELLSGYGAFSPFHAEIPRLEYGPL